MTTVTYDQVVSLLQALLQPAVLCSTAGIIVSLLCSYVPGLREWYAAQTDVVKSLGQLITVTVIVLVIGALSFTKVMPILPDGTPGIVMLVFAWMTALQSNQAIYKLSPQVTSVKEIKENNS